MYKADLGLLLEQAQIRRKVRIYKDIRSLEHINKLQKFELRG